MYGRTGYYPPTGGADRVGPRALYIPGRRRSRGLLEQALWPCALLLEARQRCGCLSRRGGLYKRPDDPCPRGRDDRASAVGGRPCTDSPCGGFGCATHQPHEPVDHEGGYGLAAAVVPCGFVYYALLLDWVFVLYVMDI